MHATACQPDLELYVLDALSAEERADIEAHVRSCAACREELARWRAVTGRLRAAAGKQVPLRLSHRLRRERWRARLRERLWSRQPVWLRVAALLLALLGIGYAGMSARDRWRSAAGTGMLWTQTGMCVVSAADGGYPVVRSQVVVAVERQGDRHVLVGMDRNTGQRLWQSSFAVGGAPSADQERVYVWRVGENNQFCLAALAIGSGCEVWTAAGRELSARHPWPTRALRAGVAWSGDGRVVLLDGVTGSTRWIQSVPDEGALSVPAANGSSLFVASSRALQALDPADGRVQWRREDPPALLPFIPPLVQCDGQIVVVVHSIHAGEGIAVCRDAATGAPCWIRETEMPWHVAVADGRVFLRGTHIQALNERTGNVAWSTPMGGCSPIEVSGGCVFTVDGVDRKGVYALRADTGKQVWMQRMLSSCSGFSVSGRMGYLSTQDGLLRAVVIRGRES